MRETEITKILTTEFICGGMEYKVQAEVKICGKSIRGWSVLKVWAMGANNKYVRIYPYDLGLWVDGMEIDISKALQEEVL